MLNRSKAATGKFAQRAIVVVGSIFLSSTFFLTACNADGQGQNANKNTSQNQTQESTGQYVSSSLTTAKVKAALLNTPNLNSTHISVTTSNGIVRMDGSVDSAIQSQLAEKTVENLDGVDKVENNLTY